MDDSVEAPLSIRVLRFIEEVVDLQIPDPETDLFETGILDSLTMVDLIAGLEEAYGIEISLEELEVDTFRTPASIAAFLSDRI